MNRTRIQDLPIAGAITGVGSLPLTCADSAIQSVAEFSPEIPFWPQLPQRSDHEAVIGQGLGILADLVRPRNERYGYEIIDGRIDAAIEILHRSAGELTQNTAAGFGAFEQAAASGLFPKAIAVKGQIEGPITLSAYLFYKDRPFLSDPALFAAVAFHVSQIACWQIDRLKASGLSVLMFIDEPALCLEAVRSTLVPEDQRLNALASTLADVRTRGAFAGLHCCAARPFGRMCRVKPDILSFDAHEGVELFFADPDVRDFMRRGGAVAYGMVPTWPSLKALDPVGIFSRWLAAASLAGDPQEIAQRAMVTATCGLGMLDQSAIAESFNSARDVGKMIRTLASRPALLDAYFAGS
ncbi:MAG TPA: hypothetical protein VGL53_27155 [Bryobacteraceae bacterium]